MRRHRCPGTIAVRPSKAPAPARRPRRFRPSAEPLDERVVPSSMVAFGNDLFGIAPGGTVMRDSLGSGWQTLGTLTGVTYIVATNNANAGGVAGGQEQVFAQQPNGLVSIGVPNGTNTPWTATGGGLFPGTMVASDNGVDGIAPGGTVWHYDTTAGWSRDGSLTNAVAVVPSFIPASGSHGILSTRGLYAERSDNSVWYYTYATGQWAATGGYLVPGTMIPSPLGIAGIAGGGTAWSFSSVTAGWAEAAGIGGLVALSAEAQPFGLLGVRPDASVWSYPLTGANPTWTNTGAFLVSGTISSYVATVGLAGDGSVWRYPTGAVPGWGLLAGLTGAVAVDSTEGPFGPFIYAQRSDHSVWIYIENYGTGAGTWVNTGGVLI